MALDSQSAGIVAEFRKRLESDLGHDERFASCSQLDRPDGTTVASRFEAAPQLWLEVAVRPLIPQVRIGIVTDDRWKNEDLEQAVEDSGDEMDEFVEFGFESVGLHWPSPPVEHYRDQGRYYYFATPLELKTLAELTAPATLSRIRQMLDGYYEAFRGVIEKMRIST